MPLAGNLAYQAYDDLSPLSFLFSYGIFLKKLIIRSKHLSKKGGCCASQHHGLPLAPRDVVLEDLDVALEVAREVARDVPPRDDMVAGRISSMCSLSNAKFSAVNAKKESASSPPPACHMICSSGNRAIITFNPPASTNPLSTPRSTFRMR